MEDFEKYWNQYGELHASMCNGNIKQFAKDIWESGHPLPRTRAEILVELKEIAEKEKYTLIVNQYSVYLWRNAITGDATEHHVGTSKATSSYAKWTTSYDTVEQHGLDTPYWFSSLCKEYWETK